MSKKLFRDTLLTSTIIAGMSIAAPASAQVQPDVNEEGSTANEPPGAQPQEAVPAAQDDSGDIIVTGTLIRNPNLVSTSPVGVIGQEEIQLKQTTNAEQLIRETPGVVPNLGSNVNNGTVGSSRVDLRGLGAQRNLVMLNSTRLTPSSFFGAVDLNNIPIALIDRVDVLTGGASTTYGADAVTGVVNFITKSDFSGLDLLATQQISERGDTNLFRVDLVLGANLDDGRGNAVLGISYMEADPLFFSKRDIGQCVISSLSGFCGGDSPTAVPTSFGITGQPTNLQIDPSGTALVPQYSVFNFNPFNIYVTPFERYNVYGDARYEVVDRVNVYARGLFSKNITSGIIAPSGVFGELLTVPGNNPFLPAGIRDQLCRANNIALGPSCNTNPAIPLGAVYRRTTEVGPRISEYTTNFFDVKTGVRVGLTDSLEFDVFGAYGESENREVRQNYVARSRLQQALNATSTTACINPANGCVPLNLFGQAGSITPEQVGFIGGITSSILNRASLAQARALLSGDVGFSLPWAAAPVSFAVGAEHREYRANREPDNLAQVPGELGGAGGAIRPLQGGYVAQDAFAELILPIAADVPFFNQLQLEAGVRYSKYKVDAPNDPRFNATSWKVGGSWEPFEGLKFRGNYQKAVRAPNIGELFGPVATGLTNLATDPCAGAAPVNNANLRAVCLAQGAPPATIGSIQQPAAGQANATGGGNPNLGPETAKTLTVGAVIAPRRFLPGFNLSIDYYRIRVTDAITAPLPGDVIAACFGDATGSGVTAASATNPACTGIRRNPNTGRLSGSPATTPGLPTPLTNAGELFTDGIDLVANYTTDLGFARLNLNFAGNWTHEATLQASPTAPVGPNCAGVFSVNCGLAIGQLQPEFSWSQRTTLSIGDIDVSLLWRHFSSFEYQRDLPPIFSGTVTGGGPIAGRQINFNRIDAYDYFDLTTRFSVTENFELTVGVTNLFDKQPPIVGANAGSTSANSGNTFPSTFDVIGRRYSVTGRLKF
jgi:iron complex outermembrane recepter protein